MSRPIQSVRFTVAIEYLPGRSGSAIGEHSGVTITELPDRWIRIEPKDIQDPPPKVECVEVPPSAVLQIAYLRTPPPVNPPAVKLAERKK